MNMFPGPERRALSRCWGWWVGRRAVAGGGRPAAQKQGPGPGTVNGTEMVEKGTEWNNSGDISYNLMLTHGGILF
jgi:hypothetical protein